MKKRLSAILLISAVVCLAIGSTATYVEAKPGKSKSKGSSASSGQNTSGGKGAKSNNGNGNGVGKGKDKGKGAGSGKGTGTGSGKTPGSSGVKNSGTIKVAQVGAGTEPDNDPKPGCALRVDFYGFRAGTLNVTISVIPPTGNDAIATDTVSLATSARGNEYQTSRTYDLSGALSSLGSSADGYHLRVDAQREGFPGNGSKTKVLWLKCAPDTQVKGVFLNRSASSGPGARVLALHLKNGALSVRGDRVNSTTARVLALHLANAKRARANASVEAARLARTGFPATGLAWLGIGMVLLGLSLRVRPVRVSA